MKKYLLLSVIIITGIGLTSLLSCQSASKASGTKLLKFNPKQGDGYDYTMVWDLEQKIMENDVKISMDALYSMDVTGDDGTVKTLTTKYKSFKLSMKMTGFEMDIDTDKPLPPLTPEEVQADPSLIVKRAFTGIAGKSFTMKIDAEGKILEVTGFDEILKSMVDSFGVNENMKAMMTASLKDQFSDQNAKDMFAQVITIFPNKDVKVGDEWDKSFSIGGKIAAKYTTHFTVKQIDGDLVTLATKTKIEPTEGSESSEINGDQTGTMLVDSKTGLVVNAEFDQNIKSSTSGVSVDMKGKGRIKGKKN